MALDETHDPALRSFVASANDPDTDFPIQNLPLGAFSDAPGAAPQRSAIAHRRSLSGKSGAPSYRIPVVWFANGPYTM